VVSNFQLIKSTRNCKVICRQRRNLESNLESNLITFIKI